MKPLLTVKNLTKRFLMHDAFVYAVQDVSFEIHEGQTFGLVGESGCGKSTLAKLLVKLIDPTSGDILFNGVSLNSVSKKELFHLRRDIQMIFQDPYASLNPRMTIEEIIAEPLVIYAMGNKEYRKKRVAELLSLVGLLPHHGSYFPHELSGGQRQRVCIARALSLHPKLIICDECIASLDVSIQAQMINLLKQLQKQLNLSYLFISHDLSMVRYLCDQVAVMYMGHIVEYSSSEQVFMHPRHPYTQGLLAAIPKISDKKLLPQIEGECPSSLQIPKGCPFSNRCSHARPLCKEKIPKLEEKTPHHFCRCHL